MAHPARIWDLRRGHHRSGEQAMAGEPDGSVIVLSMTGVLPPVGPRKSGTSDVDRASLQQAAIDDFLDLLVGAFLQRHD